MNYRCRSDLDRAWAVNKSADPLDQAMMLLNWLIVADGDVPAAQSCPVCDKRIDTYGPGHDKLCKYKQLVDVYLAKAHFR